MPINLSLLIKNKVHEYLVSASHNQGIFENAYVVKNIRWWMPPEGWIGINVDEAVNKFSMAVYKGILRDHKGSWCRGFSNIDVAEVLGSLRELSMQ